MALQYVNFSLSLPTKLHGDLKAYAESATRTMTGIITESLRWRLDAETGGRRRCASGEPCALPLLGINPAAINTHLVKPTIGGQPGG